MSDEMSETETLRAEVARLTGLLERSFGGFGDGDGPIPSAFLDLCDWLTAETGQRFAPLSGTVAVVQAGEGWVTAPRSEVERLRESLMTREASTAEVLAAWRLVTYTPPASAGDEWAAGVK